jgi:hypothetical protein
VVVVTINAMDAANLVIWRATAPKVRCDYVFRDGALYSYSDLLKIPPSPPGGGDDKCYGCGQTGHKARDCPQGDPRASGGGDEKACHGCGKTGHLVRDCPQGDPRAGGRNSGPERRQRAPARDSPYARDEPRGGGRDREASEPTVLVKNLEVSCNTDSNFENSLNSNKPDIFPSRSL